MDLNSSTGKNGSHNVSSTDPNHSPFRPSTAAEEIDYLNEVLKEIESKSNADEFQSNDIFDLAEPVSISLDQSLNFSSNSFPSDAKSSNVDEVNPSICFDSHLDNLSLDTQTINNEQSVVDELSSSFVSKVGDLRSSVILDKVSNLLSEGADKVDNSSHNLSVDLSLVKTEPLDDLGTDFNLEDFLDPAEDFKVKEETVVKVEDVSDEYSSCVQPIKVEPGMFIDMTSSDAYEVRFRVDENVKLYSREQLHAAKLISQSTLAAVVDMDMFDNLGKSMPIVRLLSLDHLANNVALVPAGDYDIAYKFFAKHGKNVLDWQKKFRYSTSRKHTAKRLNHEKDHRCHLESDRRHRKHETHGHSKLKGSKSSKTSHHSPHKLDVSHKSSYNSHKDRSESLKHRGAKNTPGKGFSSYSPDGELNFVPHRRKYLKTADSKKTESKSGSSERNKKSAHVDYKVTSKSKYKSRKNVSDSSSESDDKVSKHKPVGKVSNELSVSPSFEGFNRKAPDNYKLLLENRVKDQVRLDLITRKQLFEKAADDASTSCTSEKQDSDSMTIGMALKEDDSQSNSDSDNESIIKDLPENIQAEKSAITVSTFKGSISSGHCEAVETIDSSNSKNNSETSEASDIFSAMVSNSDNPSNREKKEMVLRMVNNSAGDDVNSIQGESLMNIVQGSPASSELLSTSEATLSVNSAPVSDAVSKSVEDSQVVQNSVVGMASALSHSVKPDNEPRTLVENINQDSLGIPTTKNDVLHDSHSQQDPCSSSEKKQTVTTDDSVSPSRDLDTFAGNENLNSEPGILDVKLKEVQLVPSVSPTDVGSMSTKDEISLISKISATLQESNKLIEENNSVECSRRYDVQPDLLKSSHQPTPGSISITCNNVGDTENINESDSQFETSHATKDCAHLKTTSQKSVSEMIRKYKIRKCFVRLRDVAKKKKYRKIVQKKLEYLKHENLDVPTKSLKFLGGDEFEKGKGTDDQVNIVTKRNKPIPELDKCDTAAKKELLKRSDNRSTVSQPEAALKCRTVLASSSKETFKSDFDIKLEGNEKAPKLKNSKVEKSRKEEHKVVSSPKLKIERLEKIRNGPGVPKATQEVLPLKRPMEISSHSSIPRLSSFKIPKKKFEPEDHPISPIKLVLQPPSSGVLKKPEGPPKTYKEWRLYREQQQKHQQQLLQKKLHQSKPVARVAPKPVIEGWRSKNRNEIPPIKRKNLPHGRDGNDARVPSSSPSAYPASRDDFSLKVDAEDFPTLPQPIIPPMASLTKWDNSPSFNIDISPSIAPPSSPSAVEQNTLLQPSGSSNNETAPDFMEFDWAKKIAAFNFVPADNSRTGIAQNLEKTTALLTQSSRENIENSNIDIARENDAWEGAEIDHFDSHSPASDTGSSLTSTQLEKTLNKLSNILKIPLEEAKEDEQKLLQTEKTQQPEVIEHKVKSIKDKAIDKMKQMNRREKHKYFDVLKRKYYDSKNLYLNEPGSRKTNPRKVKIYELFIEIREEFYSVKEFLYLEHKEKLELEKNVVEEAPYCPEDAPYSPSEEPPIPEAVSLDDSLRKTGNSSEVGDKIQPDTEVEKEFKEKDSPSLDSERSYQENRTKFSSVLDTIMDIVAVDEGEKSNSCDFPQSSLSPGTNSSLVIPLILPTSKANKITECDANSYTMRNPSPVYSEMNNSDSRSHNSSFNADKRSLSNLSDNLTPQEGKKCRESFNVESFNDPIPIVTDATFQNIPDHNLSLSDFLTRSLSNLQSLASKLPNKTQSLPVCVESVTDEEQKTPLLPAPCPSPNASGFPTAVSSLLKSLPSAISLETLSKNLMIPTTLSLSEVPSVSSGSNLLYKSNATQLSEHSHAPVSVPTPVPAPVQPPPSSSNNLKEVFPLMQSIKLSSLNKKRPSLLPKQLSLMSSNQKQVLSSKPVQVPCSLPDKTPNIYFKESPPPEQLDPGRPLLSEKCAFPSGQALPLPFQEKFAPLPSEQQPPPLPSEQPPSPLPSEQPPPPLPSEPSPPPSEKPPPPPLPAEQPPVPLCDPTPPLPPLPPLPDEQHPPLPDKHPPLPPLPDEQHPPLPPLPPPEELVPPPPPPDYDPLPPPPVPMFSFPSFSRRLPSREHVSVLKTCAVLCGQSPYVLEKSVIEKIAQTCTAEVSMDIDSDSSETNDLKEECSSSIKKLQEWNNMETSESNENESSGIDVNFLASFGVVLDSVDDTSESVKDKENLPSPVNQMEVKNRTHSLSLLNDENLRMVQQNLYPAPQVSTRGQLPNKKLFCEDDLLNSVEHKSDLEIIFSHVSLPKDILYKDDVSKYYRATPLAQALLGKHDIPFVGLQYVVEVQQSGKPDLDSCYYVCALCSKKMSSKTLVAHIRSVPHRLKFIEHHCPKLHVTYGSIQIKQWTAALVKEFSAEMEKVSASMGTFQMAVCEELEMNPLLATIKENIGNVEKFRSYMGSTSAIAGHTSKNSGDSRAEPSRSSGLPDFLRLKLKQGLKRDSPQADSRTVTPGARGRSPAMVDLNSPSPKRPKRSDMRQSRSPPTRPSRNVVRTDMMLGDSAGRVAAFKKDFDNFYSRHAEKEMYYKKNPESHPEYAAEWKMFWERRYHELASKGINPNKHDFKAEWAVFWNDRMKDIFSSVVENKKEALMKKHKITKEDLEEKRPVSPWEDDDMHVQKHVEPEHSVVGTLNALIEVESLLGAFGPAIKTLLLKALNLSTEGKKTIEIFFDADNLTLMKLSQDKLIIQSRPNEGAMDNSKRVKAIECCKWLITEVERQRSSKEDYLGLDIKDVSLKTMGMDTVQIAQQIALSLLKVGKSNVSEDDLQKILLAVSASHAKLLMEQQHMQESRATGDVQVSSTTPTIGDSREVPNAVRPLFPAAAISQLPRSQPPQQQSVGSSVPSSARRTEAMQNTASTREDREGKEPAQPAASTSSKKTGKDVASGALGQLMNAYDDDPPRDMEKLSLEDLVNLLSNFKDLSRDEQLALTSYLKRLEATDSKKVNKLREMVQKNAKTNEEARKKMEIQSRNQQAASVTPAGNNGSDSPRPPSSQSNHRDGNQPDDRPVSQHSMHSNHSQQSCNRMLSPTRQTEDVDFRSRVGDERRPENQFTYAGELQSQQSEFRRYPKEADPSRRPFQEQYDGRKPSDVGARPLPRNDLHDFRDNPNLYRDDPRMGNGSPLSRPIDSHLMNRGGPPRHRGDSPSMPRDGPPMFHDDPRLPRDGYPMYRDDLRMGLRGSPVPRDDLRLGRDISPMSRSGPPMYHDDPAMPRVVSPDFRDGRLPLPRDVPPAYRDELPLRRDAQPIHREEISRFGSGGGPPFMPRDEVPLRRPVSPLRRDGGFGYLGPDERIPPRRDEVPMYRDGFDRPLPEMVDPALGRPGFSIPRDRPWDEPMRSSGGRENLPSQGRPVLRDAFDRPIFPPEENSFGPGPSARRGPDLPREPFPERPPFADSRLGRPHYPPY